MRKIAFLASLAMLAGTIGIALAQSGDVGNPEPQRPTISIDTMRQKIAVLGYDVRRLRQDDAVFKATIVERQSGGVVRARFDETGELLRAKPIF